MRKILLVLALLLVIPVIYAEEVTVTAPEMVAQGHVFTVVMKATNLNASDEYDLCINIYDEKEMLVQSSCYQEVTENYFTGNTEVEFSREFSLLAPSNYTVKAVLKDNEGNTIKESQTLLVVVTPAYAKQYVQNTINTTLQSYYNKTEVDNMISAVQNELQNQISDLKNTLETNYYNKTEIDNNLNTLKNDINSLKTNTTALRNALENNITEVKNAIVSNATALGNALENNITAIQENITKMKKDIENTYAKKTEVEGVQNYIRGKESEWASWRPLNDIWNYITSRIAELYEKLKVYIAGDFVTRDEYNARIAELENRIAKLEKENAELKAKLTKLEKRLNSLTMTCQLVIDDAYIVETKTFARNAEIPPCEEVLKGMPYKYHYCRWECK